MPLKPVEADEFASALVRLGPFEPRPRIAVAVSGGADSLCLALLADAWARARGGAAVGLIVDHGLRSESADEARLTLARLACRGIPGEILTLRDLVAGSALAARARVARYAALEAACARHGIVHLLLGHHAGDQAETVVLRRAAGSGADGLAGMASLVERAQVRLLRPLLEIAPGRLRAGLRRAGLGWVEDPSNADPRATRARVRMERGDPEGDGVETAVLVREAAMAARARREREQGWFSALARQVNLHAEGYAVLCPSVLPTPAWGALLRVIGGRLYAPSPVALAAAPRPGTLAGVQLLPAGRWGPAGALLAVREAAAMAGPVPAVAGALWDGRFRLLTNCLPPGATLGALGKDAARVRERKLPDAVARTLPAVRVGGRLAAVPHLGYSTLDMREEIVVRFVPAAPLAGAGFVTGADMNAA